MNKFLMITVLCYLSLAQSLASMQQGPTTRLYQFTPHPEDEETAILEQSSARHDSIQDNYRPGKKSLYEFQQSNHTIPEQKKQFELCSQNLLLGALSSCCGLGLLATLVYMQTNNEHSSHGSYNHTKID